MAPAQVAVLGAGVAGPAATVAYAATTAPALRERFHVVTELDAQRLRMWSGEPLRLAPDGDPALQRRIAEEYAAFAATPRPAPGPSRQEMLEAIGGLAATVPGPRSGG